MREKVSLRIPMRIVSNMSSLKVQGRNLTAVLSSRQEDTQLSKFWTAGWEKMDRNST